jgi:acetyl esterase/lipase
MFATFRRILTACLTLAASPLAANAATVSDAMPRFVAEATADVTVPIPAPPPPPGAGAEMYTAGRYRYVVQPSLSVFLNPDTSKPHPAIVMIPGGGYAELNWRGLVLHSVAVLHSRGFTVIGVKYRLDAATESSRRADAVADVRSAMILVHQHASEWNIDPKRIGVLGQSAGANAALNFLSEAGADPASAAILPAFGVMLSPWPSGQEPGAFSFPAKTPLFIASARDDRTAPESFAAALASEAAATNPNDLFYVSETGGHSAFTIGAKPPGHDWTLEFIPWYQKLFGPLGANG